MRPHSGLLTALPAALALIGAGPASAQRSAAEQRIDSLLARMTLEEKLGQLNQLSVDNQPTPEQLDLVRKGLVGSFLNLTGAAATRDAQHIAVTESRLHIPLIFGHDVIHGYRTIFPIPLGEAASWDPEAVEAAAHVAAREAAAAGVHWTFAPMVDIARDPRWGRIAEGSGEDPYLGSAMAAARVRRPLPIRGRDLLRSLRRCDPNGDRERCPPWARRSSAHRPPRPPGRPRGQPPRLLRGPTRRLRRAGSGRWCGSRGSRRGRRSAGCGGATPSRRCAARLVSRPPL